MTALHRLLARNIRAVARARGIPLSHLADLASVSRSQLWRVLRGGSSPTLDLLERLAAVLGCPVIELLRDDPRVTDIRRRA